MECNLQKIKDDNKFTIINGKIHRAAYQAEDYLRFILGFNEKQIQTELNEFITDLKETRRKSREQRKATIKQ